MAARKNKIRHDEETRQKIQTSQLINRLTSHALGELKNPMESSQVTAALGLLKKALPDLSATEHSGMIGSDVTQEQRDAAVQAALSADG